MDLTEAARTHLAQHGLPPAVVETVEAWTGPADEGEEGRGNVSVGYIDGDRRRETTIVSLPTVDEALAMLADRDRVATMLSLGLAAMPRSHRPQAPDWVERDEAAARTRRDLSRARDLAEARASGDDPPTLGDDARPAADAPF